MGTSIPSRNVRTIILYRDPFNSDCRDAVLLIEALKVNCQPKDSEHTSSEILYIWGPFLPQLDHTLILSIYQPTVSTLCGHILCKYDSVQ